VSLGVQLEAVGGLASSSAHRCRGPPEVVVGLAMLSVVAGDDLPEKLITE
jgi:hypothetical protein